MTSHIYVYGVYVVAVGGHFLKYCEYCGIGEILGPGSASLQVLRRLKNACSLFARVQGTIQDTVLGLLAPSFRCLTSVFVVESEI